MMIVGIRPTTSTQQASPASSRPASAAPAPAATPGPHDSLDISNEAKEDPQGAFGHLGNLMDTFKTDPAPHQEAKKSHKSNQSDASQQSPSGPKRSQAATPREEATPVDDGDTPKAGGVSVGELAGKVGKVVSKVMDGAGMISGPVMGVFGGLQADQGIGELSGAKNGTQTAQGALDLTAGTSGMVAGAAGTVASAAGLGLLGKSALTAAAPTVGVVAGGVMATADGVHDILGAKNDYDLGVGAAKTLGGTALLVGTALDATGVGATVGVPLQIGGAVLAGGAYLAQTGIGKDVVHDIGQGATDLAHWTAAGASGVGHVLSELNPF